MSTSPTVMLIGPRSKRVPNPVGKKVTFAHKANILKYTQGLFLEVGHQVAEEYPDIEFEDMIVDACAMHLVMNPYRFDVLVMENMFGDILSDLMAGLVGGLGMAPGGNIGTETAMFEPVHGSAPDIAGQDVANPTAQILAGAMMLDHIGQPEPAGRIRAALHDCLRDRDAHALGEHGVVVVGGPDEQEHLVARGHRDPVPGHVGGECARHHLRGTVEAEDLFDRRVALDHLARAVHAQRAHAAADQRDRRARRDCLDLTIHDLRLQGRLDRLNLNDDLIFQAKRSQLTAPHATRVQAIASLVLNLAQG